MLDIFINKKPEFENPNSGLKIFRLPYLSIANLSLLNLGLPIIVKSQLSTKSFGD